MAAIRHVKSRGDSREANRTCMAPRKKRFQRAIESSPWRPVSAHRLPPVRRRWGRAAPHRCTDYWLGIAGPHGNDPHAHRKMPSSTNSSGKALLLALGSAASRLVGGAGKMSRTALTSPTALGRQA
ncbi:hypothetical protein MAPG_04978 [Magnaporthiopsis poae ATCC 64411]|uniref:Uncharacterized protein n=1 Tax=Magnaporthiopsis poae (strain ATCC 64411 / 73-15) TaxID=644358 RepID=A0A0C4DY68_MAGP6|nr:hypothetical protein MAPG_04978 [Magnaporthiopsis poae ATCC 64411]